MDEFPYNENSLLVDVLGREALEQAHPSTSLVDLGLDSIALIAFVVKLESRLGNRLSQQQISTLSNTTLGQLEGLIASWSGTGNSQIEWPLPDTSSGTTGNFGATQNEGSTVIVKAFHDGHRLQMAEIARRTCNYSWLQGVAHLLWLYQYLDQEPEACFAAEADGQVVGYWVGTSNEAAFANNFGKHVRKYQGDFFRLYPTVLRKTKSLRKHARFWKLVVGARIFSYRAFRLYNRQEELGPVLGMTRAHFQVDPDYSNSGVVFDLACSWLDYLSARNIDITCLPTFPGSFDNRDRASAYWRRIGYHPVCFGDATFLVALPTFREG